MSYTNVSRRQFLTSAPKVASAAAIAAGALGALIGSEEKARAGGAPAVPWPYQALDPDAVAEAAYAAYYTGACMYAVFDALIGQLQTVVGDPYTTFPIDMMKYGGGGVRDFGTLCGTLNGAAAAITLVSASPGPVIDEVFFWYCQTQLPTYVPANPKYDITTQTVSDSPLCHVSLERWCAAAGFLPATPQRAERCARLAASVAQYTTQMLNNQAAGTFAQTHTTPADVQQCMACHGPQLRADVVQGQKMTCEKCHIDKDALHPAKHLVLRWEGTGTLNQAGQVTGPWTPSACQSNPQALDPTNAQLFFQLR